MSRNVPSQGLRLAWGLGLPVNGKIHKDIEEPE